MNFAHSVQENAKTNVQNDRQSLTEVNTWNVPSTQKKEKKFFDSTVNAL